MTNTIISIITAIISSLAIFFVSEYIKSINKDRILFQRLWITLHEILILLTNFESSCNQFIKLCSYDLKTIWSIWFPVYKFPDIKETIPILIYHKKWKQLNSLMQIQKMVFSLNNLLKDLAINNIRDDLLSQRVSIETSKIRYNQEMPFIDSVHRQLPNYIDFTKKILANVSLINKHNSLRSFIYIKTNFPSKKIEDEIIEMKHILNSIYKNKVEDIKTR